MPDYEYVGTAEPVEQDESAFWEAMPTTPQDQMCAICGATEPGWLHPLDGERTSYRAWGKGCTLPMCWCLCDRCEALYQDGDDDALVQLQVARARADGHDADGRIGADDVVEESFRKPLRVLRDADLGGRGLAP